MKKQKSRICRWERINSRLERITDDRLSNLPDEVLITILSLLHYPWEIIQTFVLSKRWRHLWTFVPCLIFDEDHYEDNETFKNFVSTVLSLRDSATDLHSFTLRHKVSPCTVPWICYALSHNPKILHLKLLKGNYFSGMPDHLFTCESLEDLHMDIFELSIPDTVFLPKLKKLHISCDSIEGNCLDKLISRCPDIETLALICDIVMISNISFHTVKKLYMRCCIIENESTPATFYISAPYVENLKILGHMQSGIKLKDMSKVKKAEIQIRETLRKLFYDCEILSGLSCIENLYLVTSESYSILKEIFEGELSNSPIFVNMKELTIIGCCVHCDFDAFSSFLEHCPNLEILRLFHIEGHGYCDCQGYNPDELDGLFNDENLERETSEDENSEDKNSEDENSADNKSEDEKPEDKNSEDKNSADENSDDKKLEDENSEDKNSDDENLEEIKRFACERLKLVHVTHADFFTDEDRIERRLARSTIGIENVQIKVNLINF